MVFFLFFLLASFASFLPVSINVAAIPQENWVEHHGAFKEMVHKIYKVH